MKGSLSAWIVLGWRRLLFRWRRDQFARELAEELEFHFEQKRAENIRAGLEIQIAESLSRRQMGNTTLAKEECRDMWSFMRLEHLLQDVRHAFRMYGRTPVFTAIC